MLHQNYQQNQLIQLPPFKLLLITFEGQKPFNIFRNE